LAKLVLARGYYRVVVTARDLSKIEDITAGRDESQCLALQVDVTDRKLVEQAVKKTEETFGGIDVLVNNAGFGYLGAVEESEENEVRAMFETNFFGLARMIHVVLPGMRKRRTGCIVNISSIGGFVGFPGVGYYNATKFAVEGLSEALAKEVAPLGIKVIIVEPGPFRTDWAGRSIKKSPNQILEYAETAGKFSGNIANSSGIQPGDPIRASEAIIEAVESLQPPLRLLLGKMALQVAHAKVDSLHENFHTWEKTTINADYPDAKPVPR
jgi:NAD(P)-dependent dehydrogenase (short-subunit alcohol dehydrogenase family)